MTVRGTAGRVSRIAFLLAFAACAGAPPMPAPPPTHPASPLAAAAAEPPATDTLRMPLPASAPQSTAAKAPKGGH